MKRRTDRPTELMEAAARGDAAKVAKLVSCGAMVNAAGAHGMTALMQAAAYGQTSVVQVLLEAGAIVDKLDKRGNSSLAYAVMAGQSAVAKQLIGAGADPRMKVELGVGTNDILSGAAV